MATKPDQVVETNTKVNSSADETGDALRDAATDTKSQIDFNTDNKVRIAQADTGVTNLGFPATVISDATPGAPIAVPLDRGVGLSTGTNVDTKALASDLPGGIATAETFKMLLSPLPLVRVAGELTAIIPGPELINKPAESAESLGDGNPHRTVNGVKGVEEIDTMSNKGYSMTVGYKLPLEVEPKKYTAQIAESVENIARSALPAGATEDQIKIYAGEISLLNRDKVSKTTGQPDAVKPGETIILPGHKSDGSVVFNDSHGARFTYDPSGRLTVVNKDGTGYVRQTVGEGDLQRTNFNYFGSKPEDNYSTSFNRFGDLLLNTRVEPAARSVAAERDNLTRAADINLVLPKEREAFKRNMQLFESRAQAENLPPEEVAKVYRDLAAILSIRGNTSPMTERERARLVNGTMRAIANPQGNDQGGYPTCQTSVIENRVYAEKPSNATRILSEIAKSGSFVTESGERVYMDATNLRAHGQAAFNNADDSNTRSYSSQVFQMAARNAFLTRENHNGTPPGDMRLLQLEDNRYSPLTVKVSTDKGGRLTPSNSPMEQQSAPGTLAEAHARAIANIKKELEAQNAEKARLASMTDEQMIATLRSETDDGLNQFDFTTRPPTRIPKSQENLGPSMIMDLNQMFLGERQPERLLSYNATQSGIDIAQGSKIQTEQQLKEQLALLTELADGKKLYATVWVSGDSELLRQSTLAGVTSADQVKRPPTAHVINLISYDAANGTVRLDNQWGKAHDVNVKLSELWRAMQPVSGAEWMQRLNNQSPTVIDPQISMERIINGMHSRYTENARYGHTLDSGDIQSMQVLYDLFKRNHPKLVYTQTDQRMKEIYDLIKAGVTP